MQQTASRLLVPAPRSAVLLLTCIGGFGSVAHAHALTQRVTVSLDLGWRVTAAPGTSSSRMPNVAPRARGTLYPLNLMPATCLTVPPSAPIHIHWHSAPSCQFPVALPGYLQASWAAPGNITTVDECAAAACTANVLSYSFCPGSTLEDCGVPKEVRFVPHPSHTCQAWSAMILACPLLIPC